MVDIPNQIKMLFNNELNLNLKAEDVMPMLA